MNASAKPRIRLALVDDSEVVRLGLRSLLSHPETGIEVIGEGGTVATGVAMCVRVRPEVVLLDINLPDGTGLDACRQILRQLPETRVLMLTSVATDALVDDAIRAGAHGYLLKEIDGRGLVQAIHDVAAGKSILDPAITARLMQLLKSGGANRALDGLSPQEKRVLALIADGCTNKEVAAQLNLSEKTVKNYLSTIFEKLNVSRRSEAAVMYAQQKK
jgi:two-component system, NarL family, response regulator DevR